jgi:hypothetical protein
MREKALGSEHPVATSLSNLAVLLEAKGDYAKAEPLYRKKTASHDFLRDDLIGWPIWP